MIIVESFFCSSNLAKSLRPVAEMMQKVNYCSFLNSTELDVFVTLLVQKFDECKKKVTSSKLCVNISKDNDGYIYVYQNENKNDNSDIRLYVHNVKAVLEYDLEAKAFFDISDRLKEEGGKI